MSTVFPSGKEIKPNWFLVDASGEVLGRLAARVANLLRGKDSPHFTPFLDTGEHVIVINASKIKLTGAKLEAKKYHHFTGQSGGLKTESLRDRMAAHPDRVVRDAVEGMLPKNRLGRHMGGKLRVYPNAEHPHAAQEPKPVRLTRKAQVS